MLHFTQAHGHPPLSSPVAVFTNLRAYVPEIKFLIIIKINYVYGLQR